MTSAEHNDLMPSQKLEWVTPKISLMDAGDTDGVKINLVNEATATNPPHARSLLTFLNNLSTPTISNNKNKSAKTLFIASSSHSSSHIPPE
jgi:P pilus assembly chaperone PapD